MRMTWKDIAQRYPEFVQWVVQRFGPLPDGEVHQSDYEQFSEAYQAIREMGRMGELNTATCPECGSPTYYRISKPQKNAAKVHYYGSPYAEALVSIATYRQEQDLTSEDDADWKMLALRLEQMARDVLRLSQRADKARSTKGGDDG